MANSSKIGMAFRNMVVNWPPLMVFVTCLVVLSCVTFFLGVYVYNTEGILDRNTLTWNKLLASMVEDRYCPSPAAAPLPAVLNATGTASLLLRVDGHRPLVANGSVLQLAIARPDGLNISLEPVRQAGGPTLVCVHISGVADSLPAAGQPTPPVCDAAAAGGGLLSAGPDTSWRRCPDGSHRLVISYTATPDWDLAISMMDQERIYAHLSVTSAFLVVMAVCMLVCTVVRNRPRYTLTPGDKVSVTDG